MVYFWRSRGGGGTCPLSPPLGSASGHGQHQTLYKIKDLEIKLLHHNAHAIVLLHESEQKELRTELRSNLGQTKQARVEN